MPEGPAWLEVVAGADLVFDVNEGWDGADDVGAGEAVEDEEDAASEPVDAWI